MKWWYTTPNGMTYKLYKDMTKQTHLLIAGATGSGKSVVINGIISTLLYRLPGDCENGVGLILIDPKRVELARYKGLPHVIHYASEPSEMLSALNYAMQLTESRYKLMQKQRKLKHTGGDIYVIIDEFADLMTTQGKTVKPLIQRLAQIGRAARVHIILATQTPIAKIIPTEIKCNFDSRVGLRTRSAQDSRNILGYAGLEALPRYGEGIYMTPESDDLWEIPMIEETEIDRLVRHWSKQGGILRRLFSA